MLIAALCASITSAQVRRRLAKMPALARTNYANQPVSLAGGWACAAGLGVAQLASGQARALLVTLPAMALGGLDDLSADTAHKGLAGHLKALSEGQVTTGAAKLVGIGGAAVLTAASRRTPLVDVAIDATAIAAGANVANLFDLRPGRALKVFAAAQLPALACAASRPLAAAQLAVIATQLPSDLAGKTMLGDTGANPLGAASAYLLTLSGSRPWRAVVAGVLVALIIAGERVSFTQVIANHRLLKRLDELGRQ